MNDGSGKDRQIEWRALIDTYRAPGGELVAVNGFAQVVRERPANAELTIQLPGGLSIQGIRHQNLDLVLALLARL